MITRVLNEQGVVLHDCALVGCESSWDGYTIASGEPLEGRTDPDPAIWRTVDEHTVQHVPADSD
jgi:hypothetical protein